MVTPVQEAALYGASIVAPSKRRCLSRGASVTLDASRASAALYVIAHHVARGWGVNGALGVFFRFGQEAVIVFFLLSGFVIFANERHRAANFKNYYLRRVRRIYPLLLFAMAVSAAIALSNGHTAGILDRRALISTVFSLQDLSQLKPGVISDPYLGNDPLWSLSYEVPFYLAFPFVLLSWNANNRFCQDAVGLICCVAYVIFTISPNHFALVASYFLIWWCGAMAAQAYFEGGENILSMWRIYKWLLLLCVISLSAVLAVGYAGAGYYPFLPARHFIVSAALLAVLFSPASKPLIQRLPRFSAPLGAVASISYGLYVLHYPVLMQWNVAKSPVGLVLAVGVLLMLSYVGERLLPRLLPRAPTT